MKTGSGDREKLAVRKKPAAGSSDAEVGSLAHRFAASALALAVALALAFALTLCLPSGTAGAQEAREDSTGYEPLQSQTTDEESTEPVTGYIMDGEEEEEGSTAQQDSTSEDTSSTEDGGSVLSENPLSDSSESDSSGDTTSTPVPSETTYEDTYDESTSPATGLTTSPETTGAYSYQYPGEESAPPYTPDSGGIGTSAIVTLPLLLIGALAASAYLTGLWRPGRTGEGSKAED